MPHSRARTRRAVRARPRSAPPRRRAARASSPPPRPARSQPRSRSEQATSRPSRSACTMRASGNARRIAGSMKAASGVCSTGLRLPVRPSRRARARIRRIRRPRLRRAERSQVGDRRLQGRDLAEVDEPGQRANRAREERRPGPRTADDEDEAVVEAPETAARERRPRQDVPSRAQLQLGGAKRAVHGPLSSQVCWAGSAARTRRRASGREPARAPSRPRAAARAR